MSPVVRPCARRADLAAPLDQLATGLVEIEPDLFLVGDYGKVAYVIGDGGTASPTPDGPLPAGLLRVAF